MAMYATDILATLYNPWNHPATVRCVRNLDTGNERISIEYRPNPGASAEYTYYDNMQQANQYLETKRFPLIDAYERLRS